MNFVNLSSPPPTPLPPQKSVCSLETKVPVQEVVNTCSLINCCLTCNFNVLANSPPMQCTCQYPNKKSFSENILNASVHIFNKFWAKVFIFSYTYLAQIHE